VTSQQLVTIVVIVMVANAALISLALLSMRRSHGRGHDADDLELGSGPDSMSFGDLVAAVPADSSTPTVAGSADAGRGVFGPPPDGAADGDTPDVPAEVGVVLVDPETGLESAAAWRRAVDDEVLRLVRYRRPATVMLLELDGFDRLVDRLGEAAGARLVVATARTLQAQSRGSDHCARLGNARFGILLPETDEVKAINFVERVRDECDRWLEAGEVALRLATGWAILDPAKGATPAIQEADRRLDAERRQRSHSAA